MCTLGSAPIISQIYRNHSIRCLRNLWYRLQVYHQPGNSEPLPSYVLFAFDNPCVTFELNVWLDLSGKAATKSLSSLDAELVLQILGERTWAVRIGVIRGDEGVGDIPGVRGVSGGSLVGSAQYDSIDTRTQT